MLTVPAPAKINLTLEVLGKRPDGYHEIRSVLQTISFADSLSFQPSRKVTLKSDLSLWTPEKSLVTRAVSRLQKITSSSQGVTIEITKRVPLISGLGGDSSDAAATLKGLNKLWGLNLSLAKLLALAAELGSDVAFFLYGGTALATGRGEKVIPLPSLSRRWVVLVMPDVPRTPEKTRQLYACLQPNHYTDGKVTQRLVEILKEGKEFNSSLLFNTFENVAFTYFPNLKEYQAKMMEVGAGNVHLAGSGPTLYTLPENKLEGENLNSKLQQKGVKSYLAETISRPFTSPSP